jgi:hypothetical protein
MTHRIVATGLGAFIDEEVSPAGRNVRTWPDLGKLPLRESTRHPWGEVPVAHVRGGT